MKKRRHNGNRRGQAPTPPPAAAATPQAPAPGAQPAESAFDPVMVEHLRVTTSMIEGRKVTRQEVLEMLTRIMRQPSIAKEPPVGYGEGEPHSPPP